jgi:ferredoxin
MTAPAAPAPPPRARALPDITPRCTGCGRCVGACPPHVLWLDVVNHRKTAVLHDRAGCTGCALCAVVCPFDAIRMRRG